MEPDFTCCECVRPIVVLCGERKPEPRLCGVCLFHPGWIRDPATRFIFDPDHDGRELVDRPEAPSKTSNPPPVPS